MIEKKEDTPGTPDAESLAQLCHHLEATTMLAQSEVRATFARIAEALNSREKQLLRQIDVAHSQQIALVQSRSENAMSERVPHVSVQLENEKSAIEVISTLGMVGLTGGSLMVLHGDGSFLQRVEDYQDANQDHMSMFKPVPLDPSSPSHEAVIRFSHVVLPQNSTGPQDLHDENCRSFEDAEVSSEIINSDENCEAEDSKVASCAQKRAHPTQVQQWLKQLSAETETEPSIGEPKNFEPL